MTVAISAGDMSRQLLSRRMECGSIALLEIRAACRQNVPSGCHTCPPGFAMRMLAIAVLAAIVLATGLVRDEADDRVEAAVKKLDGSVVRRNDLAGTPHQRHPEHVESER